MNDDDLDFSERFDTVAMYLGLAIFALASATWIAATIWRLYY